MKPKCSSRPPMLHIVVSNDSPRYSPRPRRHPSDKTPVILPPVNIFMAKENRKWEFECLMLGLTTWQRNMIWKLRVAEDERGRNYILNLDRVFGIWQVLESALDRERRETLAIMLQHRPAMARKIMRQWAPPKSRIQPLP